MLCDEICVISIGISDALRLDVLHKTHSHGKTMAVHGHVTRRLRF
jgi:hypothetical protein